MQSLLLQLNTSAVMMITTMQHPQQLTQHGTAHTGPESKRECTHGLLFTPQTWQRLLLLLLQPRWHLQVHSTAQHETAGSPTVQQVAARAAHDRQHTSKVSLMVGILKDPG